ncbi:Protein GON7 [Sugiyamaella lignohabitans]|uniref:EKC/KEOPS complex subunit GON7 n=1 Tax=Sugiyamaella lignohabitans TaxID=796027 RepID=A0A167DNI0_9ASCO|nr:Protein GON7 [Sugiyamaella lignohabitans]ANB13105.1 Protein GON7 [Sugiyamaella lignohabitans]
MSANAIIADYESPDLKKNFQISEEDRSILAKEVDRDAPQEPSNSPLGNLRIKSMNMQQTINVFLTERMKQASGSATADEEDVEKKILDGDDGMEGGDEDEESD